MSSALTSLAVQPPPHPTPPHPNSAPPPSLSAPFTKSTSHWLRFFSSFFSPRYGQFALMSFIKQEARRSERVAAAAINIWRSFQKTLHGFLWFKCQINKNLRPSQKKRKKRKKKIHPSQLSTSRRGHLLGRSVHYTVTHSSFITLSLQPLCTFTLYNPHCHLM